MPVTKRIIGTDKDSRAVSKLWADWSRRYPQEKTSGIDFNTWYYKDLYNLVSLPPSYVSNFEGDVVMLRTEREGVRYYTSQTDYSKYIREAIGETIVEQKGNRTNMENKGRRSRLDIGRTFAHTGRAGEIIDLRTGTISTGKALPDIFREPDKFWSSFASLTGETPDDDDDKPGGIPNA